MEIEKKTLGQKVKALFGSLKFWLATVVAISGVLEALAGGTLTMAVFVNVFQIWLTAVFGVGVLDGIAERFGGSKLFAKIAELTAMVDKLKKEKPE